MDKRKCVAAGVLTMAALLCAAGLWAQQPAGGGTRVALVVLTDPSASDGPVKVTHALRYAMQMKAAGMDVKLIFDASAVYWPLSFEVPQEERPKTMPQHMSRNILLWKPTEDSYAMKQWKALKAAGVPYEVSLGSAEFMGIKDKLAARNVRFIGKPQPAGFDISDIVKQGYQVWIF